MKFDISVENLVSTDAFLADLPKVAQSSVVRSLNRALTTGNAEMARRINDDLGVKIRDLKKAMRTQKASASDPAATLASDLKRLPLILFRAKGPYPSRGKGEGITYQVKGSGTSRIVNAFFAYNQKGVYQRVGKARFPIRQLRGPSMGHVFAKYRPAVSNLMAEAFVKNVDREIAYRKTQP